MGLCGHDNTQTNCREPRAVQRVRVHRHGTQLNEENHPYTVLPPQYDLTPSGHDNHEVSTLARLWRAGGLTRRLAVCGCASRAARLDRAVRQAWQSLTSTKPLSTCTNVIQSRDAGSLRSTLVHLGPPCRALSRLETNNHGWGDEQIDLFAQIPIHSRSAISRSIAGPVESRVCKTRLRRILGRKSLPFPHHSTTPGLFHHEP